MDQTWKRATGGLKVVSGGKVVSGKTASGLETASVTAVVESGGARTWMHFFGVQVGAVGKERAEAARERSEEAVKAALSMLPPESAEQLRSEMNR